MPLGEAAGTPAAQGTSFDWTATTSKAKCQFGLEPISICNRVPCAPHGETERSSEEIYPPVTDKAFLLPPHWTPCQA